MKKVTIGHVYHSIGRGGGGRVRGLIKKLPRDVDKLAGRIPNRLSFDVCAPQPVSLILHLHPCQNPPSPSRIPQSRARVEGHLVQLQLCSPMWAGALQHNPMLVKLTVDFMSSRLLKDIVPLCLNFTRSSSRQLWLPQ